MYVGSGYYHLMPDQLERYRVAVADARKGPKFADAVAALRKQKYNVDSRESLKRVPRLQRRPCCVHEMRMSLLSRLRSTAHGSMGGCWGMSRARDARSMVRSPRIR